MSRMTLDQIMKADKVDLSPGDFYLRWKEESKRAGLEGGRKRLSEDDELYELFKDVRIANDKPITGNKLVKYIRACEVKCSNERAKVLAETFETKYQEELS